MANSPKKCPILRNRQQEGMVTLKLPLSHLRGSYQCLNILKYLTYNQFSLNLPIVVVQQEFADSSTILHPVDSLEPFATLLKEPWRYFTTGSRPKKKTLNVYLCNSNYVKSILNTANAAVQCGGNLQIILQFCIQWTVWNFFTLLKESWPCFTTRFRLKKKTLNVYLCNSNIV